MKNRHRVTALLLVVVAIPFILSGCTAVGFGIGCAIDSNSKHVPSQDWSHTGHGEKVRVYCANDQVISGEFDGPGYMSRAAYGERFRQWTVANAGAEKLPRPGSAIELSLVSGETVGGELIGYDRRDDPSVQKPSKPIKVNGNWKTTPGQAVALVVQRSSNGQLGRFDLRLVKTVADDSSIIWTSDQLYDLIVEQQVPLVSAVIVKTQAEQVSIPVDDIAKIDRDRSGSAKWIGLGIGLAVDVLCVVAVALAFDSFSYSVGSW